MSGELDAILTDTRTGSSRIITVMLELLKETPKEEGGSVCRKILDAHSSMAGLQYILDALTEDTDLITLMRRFDTMNEATSRQLEKLTEGRRVTVLSRSHTVENGVLTARQITVLESAPDKEGLDTARWLETHGKETTICADAAMGHAVNETDMTVVGADALLSTGFVNKIGTLPLALTAQHFHKPFYVAAPSYKFLDEMPAIGSLFEFIPGELVTAFIDEEGVS
jgi:translation initiation factor 2B subunit (eIF-2B alpha/beta/delta family)